MTAGVATEFARAICTESNITVVSKNTGVVYELFKVRTGKGTVYGTSILTLPLRRFRGYSVNKVKGDIFCHFYVEKVHANGEPIGTSAEANIPSLYFNFDTHELIIEVVAGYISVGKVRLADN